MAAYYAPDGGWAASRTAGYLADAQTRTKPAAADLFAALDAFFPVSTPVPGARVLDFGCGSGTWLNSFHDHGWQTWGIETSMDVAFQRHQRLSAIPTDPLFELVIAYHVFEHLPRPLETLTQLAGAVKPHGYCFVSVPRLDTAGEHGDYKYCLDPKRHIVAYSEACLRGLFVRAGLEPVAAFHHLDAIFTKGRPIRLRMLAQKRG
jgi:2-polyprenyl-3-methyl-5-hydroxy-6-metoxy-1,4-benzoquinol methylase